MTDDIKKYTIEEHRHRFACWAASRAASVSSVCRFRVEEGVKILEGCGFKPNTFALPEYDKFDYEHEKWCNKAWNLVNSDEVTDTEKKVKVAGEFTYGVAAKLINCYLKARFVCGSNPEDLRVKAIHPPIDSLLLKEMKSKFPDIEGVKDLKITWSNFDENDYKKAITVIRKITKDEPLWKIEYYWQGFRDNEKQQK